MQSVWLCLSTSLRLATLTDLMPAGVSHAPATPQKFKTSKARKLRRGAGACNAPVTPSEDAGESSGCQTAPTVRARHDSAASAGEALLSPQVLDLATTQVPTVSGGGSSVSSAEFQGIWQLVQAALAAGVLSGASSSLAHPHAQSSSAQHAATPSLPAASAAQCGLYTAPPNIWRGLEDKTPLSGSACPASNQGRPFNRSGTVCSIADHSKYPARHDVQRAMDAAGKGWQGQDWRDRCAGDGVYGLKLEHTTVAAVEKVEWKAAACHVLDSLLDQQLFHVTASMVLHALPERFRHFSDDGAKCVACGGASGGKTCSQYDSFVKFVEDECCKRVRPSLEGRARAAFHDLTADNAVPVNICSTSTTDLVAVLVGRQIAADLNLRTASLPVYFEAPVRRAVEESINSRRCQSGVPAFADVRVQHPSELAKVMREGRSGTAEASESKTRRAFSDATLTRARDVMKMWGGQHYPRNNSVDQERLNNWQMRTGTRDERGRSLARKALHADTNLKEDRDRFNSFRCEMSIGTMTPGDKENHQYM